MITEYFDIVNKLELVIKENDILHSLLSDRVSSDKLYSKSEFATPFLSTLMQNAQKNSKRIPQHRRHDIIVKKFAISLFIWSGPLAYEFLQKNMPEALPSIATVRNIIRVEYQPLREGIFRFDELLQHLQKYNTPLLISVGEDATRVIARVDYDSDSDTCVGFVLPVDEQGLPKTDEFKALSFETIVSMFEQHEKAKYAYVYMAQPLADGIPAFCLCCMGTNNRFTHIDVLNRWAFIIGECQKLGIRVLSAGSDGDSRLLKSMQMITSLHSPSLELTHPLHNILSPLNIPQRWYTWFHFRNATTTAFVQDTVHIGVKLKARLMKPSVLLPLGDFIASASHLRILQQNHGKDVHNLREKDLDHKDRQNFNAVERITSDTVIHLLDECADAKGTQCVLIVIRAIIDSYLRKDLSPLERVRKIWFAAYFLRYWRRWILLHSSYSLGRNFITNNAYICVELNAHSLIGFLLSFSKHCESPSTYFPIWLLGSQCCEQAFRLLRSLSSVFSTVINFGMLGLTRRLHRLQIQSALEAEGEENQIIFPRSQLHKSKHGTSQPISFSLAEVTENGIEEAVIYGKLQAKEMVEQLGMKELLSKRGYWDEVDIDLVPECNIDDDDSESEDDVMPEDAIPEDTVQELTKTHEDLSVLKEAGIVNHEISSELSVHHQHSLRYHKLASDFPLYAVTEDKDQVNKQRSANSSMFVKVPDKDVYIRKTSLVWLLQEGERVCSDRLFRVRPTQPFSGKSEPPIKRRESNPIHEEVLPVITDRVAVNDTCVFLFATGDKGHSWEIGKVLGFSFFQEKTQNRQAYHGLSVSRTDTPAEKLGVLCTWFVTSDHQRFEQWDSTKSTTPVLHEFIPVSSYLCTLPFELLRLVDTSSSTATPLIPNPNSRCIQHSKKFIIDMRIKRHIDDIMRQTLLDNIPASNPRKRKKSESNPPSSKAAAVSYDFTDHCDLQSIAFQQTVSKSGRVSKPPKHLCM